MLPFLASELEALIRNGTSCFIKPEVKEVCNTLTELAKFDTKPDQSYLSLRRLTLNLRPEELFRKSWTVTAKLNTKAESWIFSGHINDFWLSCWSIWLRGAYMYLGTLLLDKHAVALDPVNIPTGERPQRCWARVLTKCWDGGWERERGQSGGLENDIQWITKHSWLGWLFHNSMASKALLGGETTLSSASRWWEKESCTNRGEEVKGHLAGLARS